MINNISVYCLGNSVSLVSPEWYRSVCYGTVCCFGLFHRKNGMVRVELACPLSGGQKKASPRNHWVVSGVTLIVVTPV